MNLSLGKFPETCLHLAHHSATLHPPLSPRLPLKPEFCRLPGSLVLGLSVPARAPVQGLPDSDEALVTVTGSQNSHSL